MRAPSTSMASTSGSARVPSVATSPLTVTRPAAISSSHARRLPSPAWASTFCSRSPVVGHPGSGSDPGGRPAASSGRPPARRRGRPARPRCRSWPWWRGRGRCCCLERLETLGEGRRVGPEAPLELLDHVGAGHEVAERGQVGERVDAELLEEGAVVPYMHRLAGTGVAADLGDVAPLLQRAHHAVDAHAPDRRHLRPGDRLLVGDDRQGLEGGGRELGRLALEHEPLDVGRLVGVGLVAPAARHPGELEAAALVLVLGRQLAAQLVDDGRAQLQQLAHQVGVDGRLADQHDRLDGPPGLGPSLAVGRAWRARPVSRRRRRRRRAAGRRRARGPARRSRCRRRCAAGRGRPGPA